MTRYAMAVRMGGDEPLARALGTALDAPNLRRAEAAEARLGLHAAVQDTRNRERLAVRQAMLDPIYRPWPWYETVWCALVVAWWVFREILRGNAKR